jgi:hypothetical protein
VWIHILGRDAPPGMHLHHCSENKRCINEKHLELLNPSEGEDASGAIEVMVKKANQSERGTFLKAIKEPI